MIMMMTAEDVSAMSIAAPADEAVDGAAPSRRVHAWQSPSRAKRSRVVVHEPARAADVLCVGVAQVREDAVEA